MIKCAVPFIEAFNTNEGKFKNCCAANPQIYSKLDQDFASWWQSKDLNDFREKLKKESLPLECSQCEMRERLEGKSLRTEVNKTVNLNKINSIWPSRWNISFGNICNLSCWSCNEYASSVIQTQKRKLGLLDTKFEDPNTVFEKSWPNLQENILKSYTFHDEICLTILGGEPLYNKLVISFLEKLIKLKLAHRTKLEFHTNATQVNTRIKKILKKNNWRYVCMFLSVDAVDKKIEWLRYGCNWKVIQKNIPVLILLSDYAEIHCTLSVLNIGDLSNLKNFCNKLKINLKTAVLTDPWFMSLHHWDKDISLLIDEKTKENGLKSYYDLIGKNNKIGAYDALRTYIKHFDRLRRPLKEFDPILAKKLDL